MTTLDALNRICQNWTFHTLLISHKISSNRKILKFSHCVANKQLQKVNFFLHNYRNSWDSRQNHFEKHSDVKQRKISKPSIKDLANQKQVRQKVNGWKMHHISAQMDHVIDLETELTSRLSKLQMILNKHALNEVKGDVDKTQELIKANLQRSKIIQV